jgi:hypothetical protein
MPRYDSDQAEVFVFTFKEGALAAVAHDLKLRASRCSVLAEGDQLEGSFEAGALQVVCAMKDGHEHPSGLPSMLFGEIEKNVREVVLDARRYPTIRFRATQVSATEVVGQLELHGTTREVRGLRSEIAGRRVAEFTFDHRDFGIRPFTAMLGTMKVKPQVTVRVSLPA